MVSLFKWESCWITCRIPSQSLLNIKEWKKRMDELMNDEEIMNDGHLT